MSVNLVASEARAHDEPSARAGEGATIAATDPRGLAVTLSRLALEHHHYAHMRVRVADIGTLELHFDTHTFRHDFARTELPRCMQARRHVLTAILSNNGVSTESWQGGRLCDLFWIAGLASGADCAVPPDAPLKLAQWPNFPQLPHRVEHIQLCGMLSRQPMSLRELETQGAFARERVREFVHAALAAGFVVRCSDDELLFAPAARPQRSGGGLLTRLLARFGL